MKRYNTIGELLVDFREFNSLSQADLAAQFDVDIRTILRWEKNETLLKPVKEEAMVDITFIPYQVIRNLNAPVSIPTYYDFEIRKYALSTLNQGIPNPNWIISSNPKTDRIRKIKYDSDVNDILRSVLPQKHVLKPISKEVIFKATELLPELNFIIFDTSGYYSGHCVYLPISLKTYQKIKDKTINESEIAVSDLINYNKSNHPVLFNYDFSADCNDNFLYMGRVILDFLKAINKEYTYASYASRSDSYDVNNILGIDLVWEDKELQKEINSKAPPRLYEGNFKKFLKL